MNTLYSDEFQADYPTLEVAILPIIVTEVLQGFRTSTGFNRAHDILTRLPIIQPDLACHVEAALLFRKLLGNGITVRGSIDCVIAQFCIRSESTLPSPDVDFRLIAQQTAFGYLAFLPMIRRIISTSM